MFARPIYVKKEMWANTVRPYKFFFTVFLRDVEDAVPYNCYTYHNKKGGYYPPLQVYIPYQIHRRRFSARPYKFISNIKKDLILPSPIEKKDKPIEKRLLYLKYGTTALLYL